MDQEVIRHLSSWKIGIDSRPVAVGFLVNEMKSRLFFSKYFGLPSHCHSIFAPYAFFLNNSLIRRTNGRSP